MSADNMSWTRASNNKNSLGRKKVDLSVFKYGIHVPKEYHKDFLSIIPANYVELGSSEKVKLIFDDRIEEVELRNINVKGRSGDTLQIRYDANKDLIEYLKDKFRSSYEYITKNQGDSPKITVPDEIAEYIEFYKTNNPYEYKLILVRNSEIKAKFLSYIGEKGTFNNSLYQKSYKLILLLALIKNVDDEGKAEYDLVCKEIFDFYRKRHEQGLLVEQNDSKIQTEIESLSLNLIKTTMNDNAYKVISDKGYIIKKNINGKEYLSFNQDLWQSLNSSDLELLKENLKEKLHIYYTTRVEKEMNSMVLKQYLEKIMNSYIEAKNHEPFAGHELGNIFRKILPEYFTELDFIDSEQYVITGSIGQGNWANIPWIALMNRKNTTSIQSGVYIGYLFSNDMKRFYLILNQGVTELKNKLGAKGAKQKLIENAESIRRKVGMDSAIASQNIKLNGGILGELYEAGTIGAFEYKIESIPNDEKLISDLEKMVGYYEKFLDDDTEVNDKEKSDDSNMINEMNSEEMIQYIHQYITSKGYTYSLDTIKNFYLSLKTKPFVLLAGISGTGKSKLVELYAEAIGANVNNGRYCLIPVRPDWSDPSDLLGYRNIHGHFLPGPLTNIVKKAVDDIANLPYFICLDEMNLARVEYYFSDILSIIETRKRNGRIITNRLLKEEFFGDDENAKAKYSYLYIPDNLYIIGTVNMDETTFPFSKKVLDRANTIEFNHVELRVDFENFEDHIDELKPLVLKNDLLSSNYVKLKDCIDEKEHIEEVVYILEKINNILEKVGLQFGYRIRDEIIFYTLYSIKESLMSFDMAMDYAIKQKILPRIQGSNLSIKSVLIELFKIFINNTSSQYDPYANDNYEKMHNYIKSNNVKYPLCAEKICSMIRRHEVDGFTTFWE